MSGFFDKDFLQNLIDYVLIIAILVLVCYYIYKTIQENKKTSLSHLRGKIKGCYIRETITLPKPHP